MMLIHFVSRGFSLVSSIRTFGSKVLHLCCMLMLLLCLFLLTTWLTKGEWPNQVTDLL